MGEVRIRQAVQGDIDSWMRLVEQVRDSFPGLETAEALAEHRATVLEFMAREEALCAEKDGELVGALLFLHSEGLLCFLVVASSCRRQGIAKRLVSKMLEKIPAEREVLVTTYREGVSEGEAAREFYRRMGFVEGRLTEEFGAPLQEFVLKR